MYSTPRNTWSSEFVSLWLTIDTLHSDQQWYQSVTQRRLITEILSEHDSLLSCTMYSREVSGSWCSRSGNHSLSWELLLSMRTRCSCSWVFNSRTRWLPQSTTNTRPSLFNDKCSVDLTWVKLDNKLPFTSTSLTYTHIDKYIAVPYNNYSGIYYCKPSAVVQQIIFIDKLCCVPQRQMVTLYISQLGDT